MPVVGLLRTSVGHPAGAMRLHVCSLLFTISSSAVKCFRLFNYLGSRYEGLSDLLYVDILRYCTCHCM